MVRSDGPQERRMAYYQQTLIAPYPARRVPEAARSRPQAPVRRPAESNSGINAILAYFD